MERGRPVRAALALLYTNMRVPEERQGDFRAMLATCRTAERRVHELLARHGRALIMACIDRNIERTTERTRERIRRVPAGTYHAEDYLEFYHDDVFDPVMLRRARIAGDMQGTSNHTLIGGIDERTGRSFVFYEVPVGGSGAFAEHDGPSVFGTVDWADNQPILPVESIEVDYPLEIVREEITTDSC